MHSFIYFFQDLYHRATDFFLAFISARVSLLELVPDMQNGEQILIWIPSQTKPQKLLAFHLRHYKTVGGSMLLFGQDCGIASLTTPVVQDAVLPLLIQLYHQCLAS